MNAQLENILTEIPKRKIMVVGDLVADEYLYGKTTCISREAPVLVLRYDSKEVGLGGAGNAVNNLVSLGAEVIPVGVVGDDDMGRTLLRLMDERGIDTRRIVIETGQDTTTKTRILAGESHTIRQQVIRIDRGEYDRSSSESERKILEALDELFEEVDAILVSDYQYGVLSPRVIERINTLAKKDRVIITVDSRHQMFKYKGITALTPNEPEVEEALGLRLGDDINILRTSAERILDEVGSKALLMTRGSKGIALFLSDRKLHQIPIFGSDEVADVTGAGDTVIAIFTLALTAGANFLEAAQLANIGGGIVVMKRGAATANLREIKRALENP